MASQDFTPVAFNDGEPLDLDKLRQLAANITVTYSKSNSVYAALKNGQKGDTASIPVVDGGYVTFSTLAKGINGPKSIAFNVTFPGGIPFVVATVSNNLGATQATAYVTSDSNGKYNIYVNSSATVTTATSVTWIAFAPKYITV